MKIVFRLDDITPVMCWNDFYKTMDIFEKYKIKPLLGVVPDNQDNYISYDKAKDNFFEIIQKYVEDGYVIAQHGYQHVYVSPRSKNNTEFSGLSYEEQYYKLKQGKEILNKNKLNSEIFMAPNHTFDKNTLKALKELNFKYVTDGLSNHLFKEGELVFIPRALSTRRIKSFIKKKDGIATVVIHSNGISSRMLGIIDDICYEASKKGKLIDYKDALELSIKPFNRVWMIKEKLINNLLGIVSKIKNNIMR